MSAETTRGRLLEAALHLLAEGGPGALQARRLAAESGTSTMAVYTHFGGMRELVRELAQEGFVRLSRRLGQVPRTDDTVADLLALGLAYRDHALDNPSLYRLMFGVTTPDAVRYRGEQLDVVALSSDLTKGQPAFAQLVDAVRRVIAAGRIRPADPGLIAMQFWSATHGYVLLEIAGFFDGAPGIEQALLPLATTLLVGLGDTAEAVERSAARLRAAR